MTPAIPYARTLLSAALLMGLLAQIPARALAWLAPAPLLMEGLSGSLWSGQAARVQWHWGDKTLLLGRLNWSVNPFSLLWLHPSGSIESVWGGQVIRADVIVSPTGRITFDSVTLRADAALLNNVAPLFVGGRFEADLDQLVWSGQDIESMQGRLLWRQAVWQTRTGDVALGDYVAEIREHPQGSRAEVLTLSGPLQVAGQVDLQSSSYQIDLQLTGPATRNAGLRKSLDLLATPQESGYRMQWQGQL